MDKNSKKRVKERESEGMRDISYEIEGERKSNE